MKTKEELNALKAEDETVNKEHCKLTEKELAQVSGGWVYQDIEISLESENGEGETKGYNVGFFPGLSGFP